MQRAFPPKPANDGKTKTQGATTASITARRPQSEVDYIMYVLMHWQVGIKLSTVMNPGIERDRLTRFCRQHHNGTKITAKYCLERIQVPGEVPCMVLRRCELGKRGSKSLMLLMSGIEAMCTWIRKGPGHIVGVFQCHPDTCKNLLRDVYCF